MNQDKKDLKAMALLRELRADPRKDVEITSWKTTWTVTVDHHHYASNSDLATAVLEAHAKAQPRAQKRCLGCVHSGYHENDPNLRCKHSDLVGMNGIYVNEALGFGEHCGPSYSKFKQRPNTHLNGDPIHATWIEKDSRFILMEGEQEAGSIRKYDLGEGWRVSVFGLPEVRSDLASQYADIEFYEAWMGNATYPRVADTKDMAGHIIRQCRLVMGEHEIEWAGVERS